MGPVEVLATIPPERCVAPVAHAADGATGRFSGYASLFGVADLSGDIILPGAFAASLRRRGLDGVKLLYQHDVREPIGRWLSVREDATGLFVEGELQLQVARAAEVWALLRSGILDGLSIGFRAMRADRNRAGGHRHLTEIDLWEVSLVTFPMQPGARVTEVRGEAASVGTVAARRLPNGPSQPLARTIRRAAGRLKTSLR